MSSGTNGRQPFRVGVDLSLEVFNGVVRAGDALRQRGIGLKKWLELRNILFELPRVLSCAVVTICVLNR
jgi:hypothetical protein